MRETVVQKGAFGESVSSLPPFRFALKHLKPYGQRRNGLSKNTLVDDRFSSPLLWRTPKSVMVDMLERGTLLAKRSVLQAKVRCLHQKN